MLRVENVRKDIRPSLLDRPTLNHSKNTFTLTFDLKLQKLLKVKLSNNEIIQKIKRRKKNQILVLTVEIALDVQSTLSCSDPDSSFDHRSKVTAKVTKYIDITELAITQAQNVRNTLKPTSSDRQSFRHSYKQPLCRRNYFSF